MQRHLAGFVTKMSAGAPRGIEAHIGMYFQTARSKLMFAPLMAAAPTVTSGSVDRTICCCDSA